MGVKKDCIISALKKWAEAHPEFRLVYLFGSIAKGTENKLSDVDVAILMDQNCISGKARITLVDELISLLKTDSVDVVILNTASPSLKHEVIKHGILVFGNEKDRILFEESATREYLDSEILRKFWKKKLIKEVLSLGTG